MAGRYARIYHSLWATDTEWRARTTHAQWAYLMLISQPDISNCGVLTLIERRWIAYAADMDADSMQKALDELAEHRYIICDDNTAELWVRSYVHHDGQIYNPNGLKGVKRAVTEVLSPVLRELIGDAVHQYLDTTSEGGHEGGSQGGPPPGTQPQQPAASSPSPLLETSSRGPTPPEPPTTDGAAAAAVEILIEHRLTTEQGIRNAERYAGTIRERTALEHGEALHARAETGATPEQIAVSVLGLTRSQAKTAAFHLRRKEAS